MLYKEKFFFVNLRSENKKQHVMTLNNEEFKTLVMLNAANIDGNIPSEVVKVMLKNIGFEIVEKVEILFNKMRDMLFEKNVMY